MTEDKQKKVKIYQISKELNISHDTILDFLVQKGYAVKSHMSLVSDEMMNDIMVRFRKDKDLAAIHKKKIKEFKEKYGKAEAEKEDKKKKEETPKPKEETVSVKAEEAPVHVQQQEISFVPPVHEVVAHEEVKATVSIPVAEQIKPEPQPEVKAEVKEIKETKEVKDIKETQEIKEIKEVKEIKEIKEEPKVENKISEPVVTTPPAGESKIVKETTPYVPPVKPTHEQKDRPTFQRREGYQGRDGGQREGGYQGRDGGQREGGYQGRDGQQRDGSRPPYQGRDGQQRDGSRPPYQGRDGQQRDGSRPPYQGRDGQQRDGSRPPYQGRDGQQRDGTRPPYQRREGDTGQRDGSRPPYQGRDGQQRDGTRPPYQRREGDTGQRDGTRPPYQRREGDTGQRDGSRPPYPRRDGEGQQRDGRRSTDRPHSDRPRPFTPGMPPAALDLKDGKIDKTKKRKRKKRKDEPKFEGSFELDDSGKKKKKKIKGRETNVQDIDDAIKRTFAEMDETPVKTRSAFRKKRKKERMEEQQREIAAQEKDKSIIRVTELTSVNELANIMNVRVNEVMQKCFAMGMMVSINQRLDNDTIQLVADEFGYQVEFQKELIVDSLMDPGDSIETLKPRAPVVTIMGHVDHGKTSLLDYIRNASVVAGEAGGITQHIGAYKVILDNKKEITFIDTPGHEAFTSMRARGAKITDIVVLVVAADDSVMPQTVEAISHAQAAGVPIIVAINKIDKPSANVDKIKQQLSEKNILVEEWGGKYQCVEISAKFGKNVDVLLEKILLEAEVLDLKANPDRLARGVIIEAELDKGKGIFATALIQKGILRVGDPFIAGVYSGKVRAMFDERGNRVESAKPSTPIQLLGFDGIPQAGDEIIILETERESKEISTQRQLLKREQEFRQVHLITLDDISQQIKDGATRELNIIVKGDVDGSVEALSDSLMKLSNSEVKVRVIHKGVGAISESDVLLAAASQAIIIGFNVRPHLNARKLAEKEVIEIRLYNIIYNAINDVKAALEGLLAPEITEEIIASIEVREVFKVPKVGTIAGCHVQEGKITRNTKVRLIRDGIVVVNQSNISSLKRFKDDVREVDAGFECGIGLENYNDIKVGDIIEGFKLVEKKRKLQLDKA
jgi:translation initiation factor IF-2